MTTGCLFCRIVAGELPSRTVYEDADCVAFLDIAPWHRGHTLVVPRRHVPDALSDVAVLASLSPAIRRCSTSTSTSCPATPWRPAWERW